MKKRRRPPRCLVREAFLSTRASFAKPSSMAPPRDVVLTFAFVSAQHPLADLRRFRRVWSSLLLKGSNLTHRLRAAIFLAEVDGLEHARRAAREAAATLGPEVEALTFAAPSMGRCLNDALLWLRASRAPLWLHWDDAHEATRPFWSSALAALEHSPDVWLLKLDDDVDVEDARVDARDGCAVLRPHPDEVAKRRLDPNCCDAAASLWPSFSLGPGLHRSPPLTAAATQLLFDEAMDVTWPELQWRFGLLWEAAGGVVAVLEPMATRRVYDDDAMR